MMLRNIYILVILKSAVGATCPTREQLDIDSIKAVELSVFSPYTHFKSKTNGQFRDFCIEVIIPKYSKKLFAEQMPYLDLYPFVLLHKNYLNLIKVCLGVKHMTKTDFLSFMTIAEQIRDKKEIDHFEPSINDIIKGYRSWVIVKKIDDTKYVIKMLMNKKTRIISQTETFDAFVNPLKYDSVRDTKSMSLKNPNKSKNAAGDEIKLEHDNIKLLSKKPQSLQYFVETCPGDLLGYPKDILVMVHGGSTLHDYYKRLRTKENVMVNEKQKHALYVRLMDILQALEKDKFSYCDLKPANILFDPNNISNTKLIDFGSLTTLNKKCRYSTKIYAPPEFIRERHMFNTFQNIRNKFLSCRITANHLKMIEEISKINERRIISFKKYEESENKHMNAAYIVKAALEAQRKIQNYLNIFKINVNKNLEKSLCGELTEIYDNFTSNNHLSPMFYKNPLLEEINSRNFDAYTLGSVIYEFETQYLLFKYDWAIENNDGLFSHGYLLFSDIRTRYNNITPRSNAREMFYASDIMSSDDHKFCLSQIASLAYDKEYLSGELLTFIAKWVMVEKADRESIYDFSQAYLDIYYNGFTLV